MRRSEIEAGLREACAVPAVNSLRRHAWEDASSRLAANGGQVHEGTLLVVRAGGRGGLMSAVIGGWPAQRKKTEVQPVTREIAL